MQSHGVLSELNSVSCVVVPGLCLGEFTQCKCSAAHILSRYNSRCLKGGLQSSFVSRTSNFLVPNSSKGGIRRVKRSAGISPRAMVVTAVEVAEIIDTVELFHLKRQRMLSLRFLASYLLNTNIQNETHDSIEDACTALRLYEKYKLLEIYQYGWKYNWEIVKDVCETEFTQVDPIQS